MGTIIDIKTHPLYKRRYRAAVVPPSASNVKTRSELVLARIDDMFGSTQACLVDISRELAEQRAILTKLVQCVCDLKT